MDSLFQRTHLVLIAFLILVLGGIFSLRRLSVDIFPNLNYPLLNIITHYTGGSPHDIETLITRPIETQMGGLPEVRRVSSISRQELSQVTVEFVGGVDIRDARQRVAQALSIVAPDLPPRAHPVIEDLGSSLQEIMDFGVTDTDPSVDAGQLKSYIRMRVIGPLKAAGGIARIEILGVRAAALVDRPDPLALAPQNLSLSWLRGILSANHVQGVAGYVEKEYQDYAVRGLGTVRDLDDLKPIGIPNHVGLSPQLKDIASVERGFLPQRYTVQIDGKDGVAFRIFKNPDANTLDVARDVYQKRAEIERTLPTGMTITNLYDQSEIIREAANNLKSNILAGAILVVLVLFLFLGSLRRALLIALSIPLSAVISLLFFKWGDFSLNMITLGAMAVAMGMVVDDSIIVLENILRHREMEKKPLRAARDGLKEIRGATLSGTLTTVAAFIPFLFLSGIGGRLAAPFGWVMVIILMASLIISLTLLPVWLAWEKADRAKTKGPIVSGVVLSFIGLNRRILRLFLRKKRWVLSSALLVFVMSAGLLVFSPVSLLPPIDEGAILMEYILPPGTSLRESDRIGGLIENLFREDPDVETLYRRTGSEMKSYEVEPANRGEIIIRLRPKGVRKRDAFRIIRDLKTATDRIPGLITLYHQVTAEKIDESFSGLPTLFGITIYGEDYDQPLEYAGEVGEMAGRRHGVENVVNNTKYRVPEVQVQPIPERLGRYGLSSREILQELKRYLGGHIVYRVVKGEPQIPIYLMGKGDGRSREEEVGNLPICLPNGTFIPLSQLVRFSTDSGPSSISHINMVREVTLPVEIAGSPRDVIRRLQAGIDSLQLPEGYFVEFGGQYPLLLDMLKGFATLAAISLLLVYLIMSIQLGHPIHPLALLSELPLSLIGAFVAIAVTRQPLNISFWIGLITLIGVSVNNGIVLIDYANQRRKTGMRREDAIEEAAKIRARPILLTTLTSALALFPLSLGLGIGSKIHQPLAICVMGGLIVNTILTLNVLPVVYCALEDLFKGK